MARGNGEKKYIWKNQSLQSGIRIRRDIICLTFIIIFVAVKIIVIIFQQFQFLSIEIKGYNLIFMFLIEFISKLLANSTQTCLLLGSLLNKCWVFSTTDYTTSWSWNIHRRTWNRRWLRKRRACHCPRLRNVASVETYLLRLVEWLQCHTEEIADISGWLIRGLATSLILLQQGSLHQSDWNISLMRLLWTICDRWEWMHLLHYVSHWMMCRTLWLSNRTELRCLILRLELPLNRRPNVRRLLK